MSHAPDDREFYVGYLPVPPGHRRFARWAAVVGLAVLALAALALGLSQMDPGRSRWDQGEATTWTGTLAAEPYPVLFTDDGSVLLLVESGKRGAQERSRPVDGAHVRVSGHLLRRDALTLLELLPGEAGLGAVTGGVAALPPARPLGVRTLVGEIIDPKCAAGAMKPGTGRTHKECAMLCVLGGIPPMLAVRGAGGDLEHYLLAAPDGRPVEDWLVPLVGDAVEITGDAFARGPLLILVPRPDATRPVR